MAERRSGDEVCRALAALGRGGGAVPRLLVMLAHQDDETIALGGRMECLDGSRFVCVTDGAPLDERYGRDGFPDPAAYTAAREQELAQVMRHARLPADSTSPLATQGHRVSDKKARESLAPIAEAIVNEIERFQPDAVLTHPYEGGHPDHDACAFAVASAVQMGGFEVPVIEAPFYHLGPRGFTTGVFATGKPGVEAELLPWQEANKRARYACFASQAQTLGRFGFGPERYRMAPAYDFARPPLPGLLNYEEFGWGMTGEEFCAYATGARRAMGL